MNKQYKVVIGTVAAALAGIGIGMLLSPNSGKKNRKKLLKASDKIAQKVRKAAQDSKGSVKELAQEAKEKANATLNQAKSFVKSESNNVKEKMDQTT